MAKIANGSSWNPYIAGALTGAVAVLSVLVSGKYIGASTTFVRLAGMIEKLFDPERVAQMDYFIAKTPKVDWQLMLLVGWAAGSFISAITSKSFKLQWVPDMWRKRFGANPFKRAVVAFAGGFIAILGARLAGGCPSGHGLSGLMQMSISGFVSLICFFLGGIIAANLIYRGGERR